MSTATAAAAESARAEQARVDDSLTQYVSFRVDGQLLGVPVEAVQEVLNPQSIAPTPKARPEIAGLLNLRGQIVTAVDLRKRLGLPGLEDEGEPRGSMSMNVVCRGDGESVSLLVDEVGDVIDAPADTTEPVPGTLDARWRKVTTGVYRLEKELLVILDVAAVTDLN